MDKQEKIKQLEKELEQLKQETGPSCTECDEEVSKFGEYLELITHKAIIPFCCVSCLHSWLSNNIRTTEND